MRAKNLLLAALFALTPWPVLAQTAAFGETRGWGQVEQRTPLPEEEAFRAEAIPDGASLLIRLTPTPGYYLYRHTFEVSPVSPQTQVGSLKTLTPGEDHQDPHFGLVQIYRGPAEITVPVLATPEKKVRVSVAFQGCQNEGICYPPMTRALDVQLETLPPATEGSQPTNTTSNAPAQRSGVVPAQQVAAPPVMPVVAEDQRLAGVLDSRPAWQALAVFLGLGVLLGLTPCVLPMVPVLLGLIAGSKTSSTRHTVGLAGTYVLAHALVFALLGAGAAWMGGGLQATFQQAWVLVPMAAIMALLGAVLLAGGTLQMPAAVQRWAGSKGEGGSWKGAAVMGGLSSLIIGPCVAPPLAGAVLYLAQSGNPWLGAGALFALGMGMGIPMLIAAAGLGQWLPKTGAWADHLSRLFGVGFLVLAVWLANRTWSAPQAVWLGVAGVALALAWMWRKQQVHRPWSLGTAMAAVLALGWILGQATGAPAPSETQQAQAPLFATIRTEAELDQRLKQASQTGQTVVLDYYADWCTACLDMEKNTFADLQVRQRLQSQDVIALKIDVTDNGPDAKALMKRYGIVGPPATLFIQQNKEARPARLIGFEDSQRFLSRVNALPKVDRLQCQPETRLAHNTAQASAKPC